MSVSPSDLIILGKGLLKGFKFGTTRIIKEGGMEFLLAWVNVVLFRNDKYAVVLIFSSKPNQILFAFYLCTV